MVTRGTDHTPASGHAVVELTAAETHDLRRRVLRNHLPTAEVDYPDDHRPGSFHLGVRDDGGAVLAVASFSREAAPGDHEVLSVRLRGMAVDPAHQGEGLGRAVLDEAMARLRAEGIELCWANARTSALGFYRAQGFQPEGDEFDSLGIPHRVVVRPLRP